MALSLSEIQSLTIDVWMPGAYKTWQMGNIMMFKMLDAAEPKPSGETVRYPLVYARSNGGAFGPTSVFNTTKKAIANAARFPWAYFYGNTTWDIEDDVKVNGGENEVDLLMVKLDNQDVILSVQMVSGADSMMRRWVPFWKGAISKVQSMRWQPRRRVTTIQAVTISVCWH